MYHINFSLRASPEFLSRSQVIFPSRIESVWGERRHVYRNQILRSGLATDPQIVQPI